MSNHGKVFNTLDHGFLTCTWLLFLFHIRILLIIEFHGILPLHHIIRFAQLCGFGILSRDSFSAPLSRERGIFAILHRSPPSRTSLQDFQIYPWDMTFEQVKAKKGEKLVVIRNPQKKQNTEVAMGEPPVTVTSNWCSRYSWYFDTCFQGDLRRRVAPNILQPTNKHALSANNGLFQHSNRQRTAKQQKSTPTTNVHVPH